MRKLLVTLLTACGLWACGGSGGGSGPVTTPTAPSGQPAQPPAVNVGGTMAVAWDGQESSDGRASTPMRMELTQSGANVTGKIDALDHEGPFRGVASGNTLTFNFSTGNHGAGCGDAISGTASVAMNSMTGTFSGRDCAGQSVTNGKFTCALANDLTTTRFPVTGTWKGDLPPGFGGGTATWVLSQDGDVNGGNLTGSATITSNNTLKLGSGSVTGTVTNNFPGPPWAVSVTMNVTFTGACPSTMTLPTAYNGNDGQMLTVGYKLAGWSGTTCNGPISPTGFNILRQ